MVDTLKVILEEVGRVAREVGVEGQSFCTPDLHTCLNQRKTSLLIDSLFLIVAGKLGGQANIPNVEGTPRPLRNN